MIPMLPLPATRVILRRFTEADIPAFLAYRNDPEVARYQSWESCSPEEAVALLAGQKDREPGAPGPWYQIAIADRETDALLGDCALRVHVEDPRQATLGITLSRAQQGRGIAAEALSCLLDHLFSRLELHRVTAETDPENTPAWTLLERLGLRREGHAVRSLWFKGRWVDDYLYAILREEWLGRAPVTPGEPG
jgi:RimJ/RimL family protein N-acetyltransferase